MQAEDLLGFVPDPLDASGAPGSPLDYDLRVALSAQRYRAVVFVFAAIAAVLANLAQVLEINYSGGIALLAAGLASTLIFTRLARRSWRKTGRVNLIGWWVAFDVLVITAMVPCTGGVASPFWIFYLACAGTAALHRGRRFAVLGASLTAVVYIAVIAAQGDLRGFDHGFYLALFRLVFLGGAASALLLNTLKLRESGQVIGRLKNEAETRAGELERLNGELQDMADLLRDLTLTDALTGLRNRRYLQERIADEVASSSRWAGSDRRAANAGLSSGFLMLEVDNFKAITDAHGQPAGDLALKHVADVLRQAVRSGDTVARWGGEEFVVLLQQTDAGQLARVAEKICSQMRSKPLRLSPTITLMLTSSVGYALVDPSARERGVAAWDEALAAADVALYAARRGSSRNAELAEPGPRAVSV